MSGKQTWNFDVDHSFEISDVGCDMEIDGRSVPDDLAAKLRPLLAEGVEEISIKFNCNGYHWPARLYGPPEDCYPEEGDEERELLCASLGAHDIGTQDPLFIALESFLSELLYEVDVDYEYDAE
jgi:hypothetical protein